MPPRLAATSRWPIDCFLDHNAQEPAPCTAHDHPADRIKMQRAPHSAAFWSGWNPDR
jgi:hypothetical protein